MKQYEPCIQNDNNNNNNIIIIIIIIIIKWKKNQKGQRGRLEERAWEREKYFIFFLSLFFSQIYKNRTVGFHWG